MPDNYKAKISKVKVIQDYIVNQMASISQFHYISKKNKDLIDGTDFPLCAVLFTGGENTDVREKVNAVIHFDIVIKNRLENELDNLDIAELVADKFEDYRLGGNCIGLIPGFPKNYYSAAGELDTVETVISLTIEI